MTDRTFYVAAILVTILAVWVALHGLDLVRYALGIPVYHQVDYDPGMTRDAATVKPLMAALDRYHHQHGRFPADLSQLVPYLPSGLTTPAALKHNFFNEWAYSSHHGNEYRIQRWFGRERLPPLYKYEGSQGHWFWDTGETEIPIRLNP
jgi:hypothetical protein